MRENQQAVRKTQWRDPIALGFAAHRGALLLRLRWHDSNRHDAGRHDADRPTSNRRGLRLRVSAHSRDTSTTNGRWSDTESSGVED